MSAASVPCSLRFNPLHDAASPSSACRSVAGLYQYLPGADCSGTYLSLTFLPLDIPQTKGCACAACVLSAVFRIV